MILRIRRINPNIPLPAYQTPGSAGLDLCACVVGSVVIQPGCFAHIPTGIAIELPPGHEGQVRARSGLARKHGIGMVNGVGTIDADYRGEVGVLLINHGAAPFEIKPGDRIAQLVIAPVVQCQLVEVGELSETSRGAGGFGSTGVSTATVEELTRNWEIVA